jgi:uncharacterized membrane protein YccC
MNGRGAALSLAAVVAAVAVAPVPAHGHPLFVITSGKKFHALEQRAAQAEAGARTAQDAYDRERRAYEREAALRAAAEQRLAQAHDEIARLHATVAAERLSTALYRRRLAALAKQHRRANPAPHVAARHGSLAHAHPVAAKRSGVRRARVVSFGWGEP